MCSSSKPGMPSIVTEDSDSVRAIHTRNNGEGMPPAPATIPADGSRKPSDPTFPGKPRGPPAGTPIEEDEAHVISPTHDLSIRSPVDFVLGNFFLATFLISLIIFIVSFIVTWFTVLRDARFVNDRALSNATGIAILGHGLQLDLDAHVLSISWKVVVCGVPMTSEAPFWTNCEPADKAVDIYLNDPSKPVLSFLPHTELTSKALSIRDPPGFTTVHQFDKYGKRGTAEDLMVPFERYTFHAFAFAIDPTTNSSVHIAMFSVLDTLADFVIRSHDATDVSKFTYDSGDGLVTTEVESRVLRAEIERSAIAKAFAVCLFLINWALTIGSVYATALVASGRLEVTSMVTGLPFSALLAIPTVRSLCSGLPPLGVYIDAAVFFVQIATIGLCLLVVLRILTRCQQDLLSRPSPC